MQDTPTERETPKAPSDVPSGASAADRATHAIRSPRVPRFSRGTRAPIAIGLTAGGLLGASAVLFAPDNPNSLRAKDGATLSAFDLMPGRSRGRQVGDRDAETLGPPGLPTTTAPFSVATSRAFETGRAAATSRPAAVGGVLVRIPHGESLSDATLPGASRAREVLTTIDGARYFAFGGADPSAVEPLLPKGWDVFVDGEGTLQSAPQRGLDPSASLQWHNFGWPSLLLDRFPFTLDQNAAGLRARRVDEFVFWNPGSEGGVSGARPEDLAPACPGHQPVTLQVNRLWNGFEDEEAAGGEVLLHDGPVDASHPDLEGRVLPLAMALPPGSLDADSIARDGAFPSSDLLGVHGTHVAGVMAARRNDHGVTGVAPGIIVRSLALRPSRKGGTTVRLSDVLAGISVLEAHVASRGRSLGRRATALAGPGPAPGSPAGSASGGNSVSKAHSGAGSPPGGDSGTSPGAYAGTPVVYLGYAFEDDVVHLTARGTPLRDALESLLRHDVVVVVPAGNSAFPTKQGPALPAALAPLLESSKGVLLPVSAAGLCSDKAWFSRVAPLSSGVMIFAPGERIFSSLPAADYGPFSGTSQAAAQIAGLLAVASRTAPSLPARGLVEALVRTAQPLPHLSDRALLPDAWSFVQEVTGIQSKVR